MPSAAAAAARPRLTTLAANACTPVSCARPALTSVASGRAMPRAQDAASPASRQAASILRQPTQRAVRYLSGGPSFGRRLQQQAQQQQRRQRLHESGVGEGEEMVFRSVVV